MTFEIRRVVTGHDENGKAVVKFDSVPNNISLMRPGVTGCVAWTTDEVPAEPEGLHPGPCSLSLCRILYYHELYFGMHLKS